MAENKNKMMMVIIIILLTVLLVAIAVVSLFAYRLVTADTPTEEESNPVLQIPVLTPQEIDVIKLESPIGTNLALGANGETHFLRVSFAIGVDNTDKKNSADFSALITEKEPIIRDVMLGVIKSKTYEELSRPDGRDMLRDEVLDKLQNTFRSNLLVALYISDWSLQ